MRHVEAFSWTVLQPPLSEGLDPIPAPTRSTSHPLKYEEPVNSASYSVWPENGRRGDDYSGA